MNYGGSMGNKNPINKSGIIGEERMEKFLKDNDIPYIRNISSGIDFILFPNSRMEDRFYIDIKNQDTGGGRDLAVGGCVWQYQTKYGFKECYIVEGKFNFKPMVREFANTFAKTHFVKFEEMKNILLGVTVDDGVFFG